jgi:DNA-binding transcriptional MerR regulator
MTTVTFDTHEFIKRLEAKGFQTEQAEGVTEALKEALTVAEIATKRDLKDVEAALKRDIRELDNKIEALRLEVKAEIAPLKWMCSATIAGVVALIIKTFF